MFKKIKDFVLSGKEKAVAAFVISTVGTYMSQNGLTIKDIWSKHGLWALIVGVVTHQVVYWANNSSKLE